MLGSAPLSTYPLSTLPLPPTPAAPVMFSPVGATPSWLSKTIPSYLYFEYRDDEDCQAFVDAYNQETQGYVDWFTSIGLPIYTGGLISGALLDWVAEGLYGFTRPTLTSGNSQTVGPFDTWAYNTIAFNRRRVTSDGPIYVTSDDIFKRVITWNFYKGDGNVFTVRWLKRRIMRFLTGVNGTAPPVPVTYQVSVTFAVGNRVVIDIISGLRRTTGGALFDRFAYNTTPYNQLRSEFITFGAILNAAILAQAIAGGVLQLPFQFQFIVQIQGTPTGFLYNNGGTLGVLPTAGWPTSSGALPAGSLWSNGGEAAIVSPTTPGPAPPVYFPGVSASALLATSGVNLPTSPGPAGSGQLWNDGYVVAIS
jgi:hypothetical protein